jgi:hypothetical protein
VMVRYAWVQRQASLYFNDPFDHLDITCFGHPNDLQIRPRKGLVLGRRIQNPESKNTSTAVPTCQTISKKSLNWFWKRSGSTGMNDSTLLSGPEPQSAVCVCDPR